MHTDTIILVVDDQPDLLQGLALTLEAGGYQVVTASDGLEAIDVLDRQEVCLVLSDISMPRMNGIQLYECVLNNPQWATVPFLFLTAWFPLPTVPGSSPLTIDDCLIKPVQPEEILQAVDDKLCQTYQLC